MAAILNSAILNLAILDSAILVFPLKFTHTCQDWFPPFAQKKPFTHSFWLNLMMAAILNSAMLDSDSAMLDSDTFLSSLRFTQKYSHSTLILTQNNSIWLKLDSWLTQSWRWQPSWILAMLDSDILAILLELRSHLPGLVLSPFALQNTSFTLSLLTICTQKTSLIQSDSTWWWQPSWILPSWILPSWIQPFCTKLCSN